MVSRPILFPCSDIRIKQSQDKERRKATPIIFLRLQKIRVIRPHKSIIPSRPVHKNDSQNIREFVSNTNGNEGLQGYLPPSPLLGVSR